MTKRMRELKSEIIALTKKAGTLLDEDKGEEAAKALDDADALQKKYDLCAKQYAAEKALVPETPLEGEPEGEKAKTANGFDLIAKAIRGVNMAAEELKAITLPAGVSAELTQKGLVSGDDATHGENYLIPADVSNKIVELRRQYKSAKDIVTVKRTSTLTGSVPIETSTYTGLTAFDDGDTITEDTGASWGKRDYKIALMGVIFPVSNILLATEVAGLMEYLQRYFVRKAIISENTAIFTALKGTKTATAMTSVYDISDALIGLDPSCLMDAVVVTNQTGYKLMTGEKDKNGRSLLTPNPTDPKAKVLDGAYPIIYFPDALLPNVSDAAPVFYGDTKRGVTFVELIYTFFASSTHAMFSKNQTVMRVIEGFDVLKMDTDAYGYALLSAPVVEETDTDTDTDTDNTP